MSIPLPPTRRFALTRHQKRNPLQPQANQPGRHVGQSLIFLSGGWPPLTG